MAKFNGVLQVIGGGKFFGEIDSVDNVTEFNFGVSRTDVVSVSGVRGQISLALVNVIVTATEICPWDAIDLRVAVS